ncbi:MAG: hypothetical protein R2827_05520 [Bdellovibrionales bacterium]
MKKDAEELQGDLEEFNKVILKLMSQPNRNDAGVILRLVTYSQRLKDKLVNYHILYEAFLSNNGKFANNEDRNNVEK